MDAGLAKVLNSTVGTSTFKALNEILSTKLDSLETNLTSGKSIVASDEVYQDFPPSLSSLTGITSKTEKDVFSFTMPLDGSVNLAYRIGFQSKNLDYIAYLKVYKNGVLLSTINHPGQIISDAEDRTLFIEGNKGDVFKISTHSGSTSCNIWLYLYSLNATVIEGKTMNIQSLV